MTDTNNAPKSLSTETIAEIRKQAISEVAKWVVIAFVALIGLAASGWWFYLQKVVDEYIVTHAGGVPASVVAFDQPNGCPKGWTAFENAAGRTIIGTANPQQASSNSVVAHAYRDTGGRETHKLTEAELPPLKFSFSVFEGINNSAGDKHNSGGRDYLDVVSRPKTIDLSSAGKSEPVATMPPYIALFYCKKD